LAFGLLVLLLLPLLQSCGGGDGACSIRNQNRQVHEALLEDYLWYRDVPETVNYGDFDNPAQLLDFLRKDPPDRFSFITDAEEYRALFNSGQYAGFGFSFEISADERLLIRFVYADSPAWQAGMRRGDEILSVNGEAAADLIAANDWEAAFGPKDVGVVGSFRLQKPDGGEIDIVMEKAIIDINTVLHQEVIDTATGRIGYLVFSSFLNTSYDELESVFENFRAVGVDKVILDLRYNGGGAVWVADALASWLYGNNQREVFAELRFNELNSARDYSYNLVPLAEGIVIDELIVITTGESCSASEMLINGLKPFMTVRTVGSTTCGKPVGMSPEEICDKMLVAVNFEVLNASGEGGYFDGLPAECPARDDVAHPFGDTGEPMLSEALYLAEQGQCSDALRSARGMPAATSPIDAASLRAVIGAW
jgi:hypothetical protein